jgi:methionyl-tRNA formyltransferase
MKTVFMGTPEFAVPCLKLLRLMPEINLTGVVTQPDRPKGRGYHYAPLPVKETAVKMNLPIVQPPTSTQPELVSILKEWDPDLIIVVAFGQLLPEFILRLPTHGCINVHASLLPKYRGAAPIQQCLIDGNQITGITTMQMDTGMDTGPILMQDEITVSPLETAVTLHDRLSVLGAVTLKRTIEALVRGDLKPKPQNHNEATYAPRLTKESGRINWNDPAEKIDCLVRGTQPWPTAYSGLNGKTIKIWKSRVIHGSSAYEPGTIIETDQNGIQVSTGSGRLLIEEMQLEGKKRMTVSQFLSGNPVEPKTRLGD